MKVLIIPDVHLKPRIFDLAGEIMKNSDCERAVFVGDLVDDWGCERNVKLYEDTFQKASDFVRQYPDTLWCYGNHDLAYLWNKYDHPGYSVFAKDVVCSNFSNLKTSFTHPENMAIMHQIDNVLFSHAGLVKAFVYYWLEDVKDDIDAVIDAVNNPRVNVMWDDISPVWARPQEEYGSYELCFPECLQVVGHTPVKRITQYGNLLTTDTFSTYSNGEPYGNEEMCWVDTVEKTWGIVHRKKR